MSSALCKKGMNDEILPTTIQLRGSKVCYIPVAHITVNQSEMYNCYIRQARGHICLALPITTGCELQKCRSFVSRTLKTCCRFRFREDPRQSLPGSISPPPLGYHALLLVINVFSRRATSTLNCSTSFQQSSGFRSWVLRQLMTSFFAFSTFWSTSTSFLRPFSFCLKVSISFWTAWRSSSC